MATIVAQLETYVPYLEDVRTRVYRVAVASLGFFVLGFAGAAPLLRLAIRSLHIADVTFVATSPFQFVDLAMSIGMFVAALCGSPFLLYHLYGFLHDSLERKEKRFVFLVIPVSVLLFVTGFAYGFGALYYALGAIARLNRALGVVNLWEINRFLTQIIVTSALLGLVFQFPVVLTFLMRQGVVAHAWFRTKRRHAYVAAFVFVSLLPPTDGLSLVIMALPILAIYEVTLLVNRPRRSVRSRAGAR